MSNLLPRLLGAVALVLAAGAANAYTFKHDAAKFAIEFPAKPTLDKRTTTRTDAVGTYTIEFWQVQNHNNAYWAVAYLEYKDTLKGVDPYLATWVKPNQKIIQRREFQLGGLPARDLTILDPASKSTLIRRIGVVVGKRGYTVSWVGDAAAATSPPVVAFMNSFRLLK